MELNINIHETVGGDLFVKELAYDEGAYATSVEQQFEEDSVLFTESASITVLKKHTSVDEEVIKAYIHNHESTDVANKFQITEDGWYEIVHYVVPNLEWLEQAIEVEYLDRFERVFVTDGTLLYEYIDGKTMEIDIDTLLENEVSCNVWMVDKDAFSLFNLWQCYLNYCKKLFEGNCDVNGTYTNCDDCDDEATKNRNLIWIFLNAIQYLVKFGEFEKAQELLESISGCNSLCNNEMFSKNYDCGCGK